MTASSLLTKAYALREEGNFEAAYKIFSEMAERTDDALEKANIILTGVTALVPLGDKGLARKELERARGPLAESKKVGFGGLRQQEFLRVTIGLELEEASLTLGEGRNNEALGKYSGLTHKYERELAKPGFEDIRDTIKGERAFLLVDGGNIAEALPILRELEPVHGANSSVPFYLGFCYLMVEDYARARPRLEAAIELGLPSFIDYRAHCALGVVDYREGNYVSAKMEFEQGAKTASKSYLKEARVWQWLEVTSEALGLIDDAEKYAQLARIS